MRAWLAIAAALLPILGVGAEPPVQTLQQGTRARILKPKLPDYPNSALMRGQEGWVTVSFSVRPDGTVADPVVEDSSGQPAFERAALRAVLKQRFQPATWNGRPIEQCAARQQYKFILAGRHRASPAFIEDYKLVNQLIRQDDVAGVEAKLLAMTDAGTSTNYESARLWLLRASVQARKGDKAGQLKSLQRATAIGDYALERQLYLAALRTAFVLEVELQRFGDALGTWRLLHKQKDAGDLTEVDKVVAQINDAVDGPLTLSFSGPIEFRSGCEEGRPNYQHELLRRKFALEVVAGTASDFELRCDWRRIVDKVDPGKTWTVPDSWGWCQIFVFGDKGSQVKVVEYPLEPEQRLRRFEPLEF